MNSSLFEPAILKSIKLKNRFVRSATHEGFGTFDGRPTMLLQELYEKLAKNETGLIITGSAMVEAYKNLPNVEGLPFPLAIDEDRYIDDWKKITNKIHELGAKIAMQIVHPGRQGDPNLRGSTPIAPSPVPIEGKNIIPQEMTINEIKKMVEIFAQSCRRVKASGFDAVQLHASHGYLLSNFISPYANVRDDKYGGNTKNRARFIVEIVKRTRELIGSQYPILIKMNFNDFIEGGLDKNEAINIAKIIVEAGIDCIEVSGGTQTDGGKHISVKGINKADKEAYFKSYAKDLKKNISVPVMLVGGIRSLGVMEKLIDDGICDYISMSRPFIREPELIRRWKEGNLEKAMCVSCNQCFKYWHMRSLRCYVEQPVQ